MIKKLTNKSDLNKCCAQIELVEQLITQPETFDIHKVLVELQAKKKLLMKYKPRDYATILKEFFPEKEIKESKKTAKIKNLKAKLEEAQKDETEEVVEEIPGE